MSDRPGKSRPMPAAPFDDESIPVLTERLTLPALDLDITLPTAEAAAADSARIDVPSALPPALPSPEPQVAPAAAVPHRPCSARSSNPTPGLSRRFRWRLRRWTCRRWTCQASTCRR
jgi:hypothetical protein